MLIYKSSVKPKCKVTKCSSPPADDGKAAKTLSLGCNRKSSKEGF